MGNSADFFSTLIMLWLLPISSYAFINIESLRQENINGISGSAAAQINGQTGNTEKNSESFTTLTMNREARDEVLILASYQYGSTSEVKDTNNGQLHFRYTFFDRQPDAIELFLQDEFDQFKNLTDRELAGADLRERLLQLKDVTMFYGLGGFYEIEDYNGGVHKNELRASTYLSFAGKIADRLTSSTTAYFQPLFTDFSDNRVRLQADVDLTLDKYIVFSLVYALAYDSWVPPNTQQLDTTYLTGLKLKY